MKRDIQLLFITGFLLVTQVGWAQSNTFPGSGNVGVGTANPDYLLHVIGSNIPAISIENSNTDAWIDLYSGKAGAERWSIGGMRDRLGIYNRNDKQYYFSISNKGNLGIGTVNPANKLHVVSSVEPKLIIQSSDPSKGSSLRFYDETGADNGGIFYASGSNRGDHGKMYFRAGSQTGMVLDSARNLGIGTLNPDAKLTVAGTAKAEEVIVTENAGADFVFEEDYVLPDLTEVEAYIKQFKHLSGIPTAREMKRDGVKVGELQMKLLQKIEELTLYTIEQQKEMKKIRVELSEKLQQQQQEIERLKQLINSNH